jgi:hypothetical protein
MSTAFPGLFLRQKVATGSAAEAAYLVDVSTRLLKAADGERVGASYSELVAKLTALINSLSGEP